uniref:Uncharacterized protein n=1 Tax=Parascaris univalens TaxID=6257 RepID=A0A915ARM6_PARUN
MSFICDNCMSLSYFVCFLCAFSESSLFRLWFLFSHSSCNMLYSSLHLSQFR